MHCRSGVVYLLLLLLLHNGANALPYDNNDDAATAAQHQRISRSAVHHADDMAMLEALHTSFDDDGGTSGGDDMFVRLHALLLHMHTHAIDDLPASNVSALFAPLLHTDITYLHQGMGECNGRAQVVSCLQRELTLHASRQHQSPGGDGGDGGVQYEITSLRKNAAQVTRVLEIHRRHANRAERSLDVYFVYYGNKVIARLEKLPTVERPLLFDTTDTANA